MLTVVKRLFDLVKPKAAVFGEKDFQQLFLIKQMVKQFMLPIEIISGPTIRDLDQVAISSRNVKLNESGRSTSLVIPKVLKMATVEQMKKVLETESEFKVDYLEVIDETTFMPAVAGTVNKRVIIAGWVNQVRLLDNMRMGGIK